MKTIFFQQIKGYLEVMMAIPHAKFITFNTYSAERHYQIPILTVNLRNAFNVKGAIFKHFEHRRHFILIIYKSLFQILLQIL